MGKSANTGVAKVNTNPSIGNNTSFNTLVGAEADTSAYINSILNSSLDLGNWAANIATGGNVQPLPGQSSTLQPFGNNTFAGSNAGGYSYGTPSDFTVPTTWNDVAQRAGLSASDVSQFQSQGLTPQQVWQNLGGTTAAGQPATGPIASPGMVPWSGQGGTPGVTAASAPPQNTTLSPAQIQQLNAAGYRGFIDPSTGENRILQAGETLDPSIKLTGNALAGGDIKPSTLGQFFGSSFGQAGPTGGMIASSVRPSGTGDLYGPLLRGAVTALQSESATAGKRPAGLEDATLAGLQNEFFSNEAAATARGDPNAIPGGVLPAGGLYPDQSALVDAATAAGKQATATQLATEGLSSSTMGAELGTELEQAGAGEKGKLIQGNISLAQNAQTIAQQWQQTGQRWAELGMGEQAISMAEQQQQFQQFATISEQYKGLQAKMWDEAIQGYGVFSGFIGQLLSAYGLGNQAFATKIQGEAAQAQAEAQIESTRIQANAESTASIVKSVTSMIGSMFGAAAGAGLFCWVAREVFRIDDERWLQFADWMYHNAPKWLLAWYMKHGERIAQRIHDKPRLKSIVKAIMQVIIFFHARQRRRI